MELQESEIQKEPKQNNQFPFLTIWLHPKKTLRFLLDTNPDKHVILLSIIQGVFCILYWANMELLGDMFPFHLWRQVLLFVGIGSMIGPIRMYLYSFLYQWIGSRFGGKGRIRELRTAFAWSSAPYLLGLPIWLFLILHVGHYLFGDTTPYMRTIMHVAYEPLFISLVLLVFWRIILLTIHLAEAHQLSFFKSIAIVLPLSYADLMLNLFVINTARSIFHSFASLST